MTGHQTPRRDSIRPLASIPNKEGAIILGVRKDGTEDRLVVFVDKDGFYKVDGYPQLVGWKLP
jgi:hypothetical protein